MEVLDSKFLDKSLQNQNATNHDAHTHSIKFPHITYHHINIITRPLHQLKIDCHRRAKPPTGSARTLHFYDESYDLQILPRPCPVLLSVQELGACASLACETLAKRC